MLKQGVPLAVISKMLGHSTISVTADIYAHVLDEGMLDATSRFDTLLTGS